MIDPIAEANLANILAKLKAGKILTDKEEKKLADYQARQTADQSPATNARGEPIGVADSMKQASALTGINLDRLERAKSAGCAAFRGSRVHCDELLEWMEEHGDTLPTGNNELDALNLAIAREKLRRVTLENDERAGKTIARADVADRFAELGTELKRVLRQKLEDEGPRRLRGKSEDELRALGRDIVDEICDALAKGDTWTEN